MQWTIQIPDETDRSVRRFLSQSGCDLSEFVNQAVQQAIFWNTVSRIQQRNTDLSPDEAQALADEAVAEVRADRS